MATTYDEFGNVVEVVTAQELVDQQNREFMSSGGNDDDKGITPKSVTADGVPIFSESQINKAVVVGNAPAAGSAGSQTPNSGTTIAGKSGTPAAQAEKPKPGKRLQNPLGNFSSYTYQISLYMITPDAYDAFVASGRKNINAIEAGTAGNGAFLIAQSGGINNTSSKRAPGFDVDFYIDDLKINQSINGKDSGTSTNTTAITFNITEPYGFSFITKLKNAANALAKVSRSPNYADLTNPSKQFFIIGIRFQGYNQNGTLISSTNVPGTNSDPQGNQYGIYERYFDILLTGMKFKLEGRAVTYNITAVSATTGAAFGIKRGIIDNGAEIVGGTVYEALMGEADGKIGLLAKLNNDQKKLLKDGAVQIPTTYNVKFLGESENTIKDASIVSKADLDKLKFAMIKVKNSSEVNENASQSASVDTDSKTITFVSGTPILQAVTNIVLQSEYMERALRVVYAANEEPDPSSNGNDEIKSDSKRTIKWFNVSAEVKCKGWDQKQGDFVFDITYVIQPYETPVVQSAYANKATPYYGPHKRYDYWYTGKNSEIIKYDQTMDNTFFNVALNPDGSPDSQGGATDVATVANKQQGQPKQGELDRGLEAQNSYMTSLFDPGAYAKAKITILGDPDFLMQTSASSVNTLYNQFYGTDGFTISPNGGQVFIEINFKEPTDYKNSTGTMGINESILFWKYPASVQKELDARGGGISYMVLTCTSTFRGGKFEQELSATINTFGDASGSASAESTGRPPASEGSAQQNRNTNSASSPASTSNGKSTTSGNGFVPYDEFAGVDAAVAKEGAAAAEAAYGASLDDIPAREITSPTGGESEGFPVVDDDASSEPLTDAEISAMFDEGGREEP